jgi:hypothetical protein
VATAREPIAAHHLRPSPIFLALLALLGVSAWLVLTDGAG